MCTRSTTYHLKKGGMSMSSVFALLHLLISSVIVSSSPRCGGLMMTHALLVSPSSQSLSKPTLIRRRSEASFVASNNFNHVGGVGACSFIGSRHPSSASTMHFHNHQFKSSSSSLSLFPFKISDTTTASSLLLSSIDNNVVDETTAIKSLAEGLGYLIGAASILLYTPIAVRILRSKSANGLTVSTWWLKLTSFTCTDVYNIKNGFPIAAFSETLIITLEAAVVLGLVTYYKKKRIDITTYLLTGAYLIITAWALFSPFTDGPPDECISYAQILATILNTSALVPQLKQNLDRRASGDYSPITASLASVGCTVRLFTTMELADGDPLLLLNYGVALLLNLMVLCQVLYFGTQNEGKSLVTLFLADVKSSHDEDEDKDMKTIEDVKLADEENIMPTVEEVTTLSR